MDAGGPERTPDGRYLVIGGRRWRASDPALPAELRTELVAELMAARRAVRTDPGSARPRVQDAKVALGERGEPWWEPPTNAGLAERRAATARTLGRHRGIDAGACAADADRVGSTSGPVRMVARRRAGEDGRMTSPVAAAGTVTPADGLTLTRMGYGAMQLAGPHVFGPPKDRARAIAVLREVVEAGITHIDTSDYYGPYVTNEIIKEALHPYPESLRIVTKVGARRDSEGGWPSALTPDELRTAVHENLDHLGVDAMDVVNLRVGAFDAPTPGSLEEPFTALAELQQQGLIKHLGVSNVNAEQVAQAQRIAPVVCVQNYYNVAHRDDDALIDALAEQGIAYVPFFPLGGFSPLQSQTLSSVATRLGASDQQVALAWLLQRSPVLCVIPGTSSPEHLRENVAAAALELPADALAELDGISD